MNTIERKLLRRTLVSGLVLTALIAGLDRVGFWAPLERFLADQRARWFQFGAPPPTDRLVHVHIDDASIDQIGRWPWSREITARLIDELASSGAKVIALDVLFNEAQPAELRRDVLGQITTVEPDALLASAFARAGNVLAPVTISFAPPDAEDPSLKRLEEVVADNPELARDEAVAKALGDSEASAELRTRLTEEFSGVAQRAMFRKVQRLLAQEPPTTSEAIRRQILPRAAASGERSDGVRRLETAESLARTFELIRSRMQPAPRGIGPLLHGRPLQATIPTLARAARYTGFVDFVADPDGAVRHVPLIADYDGVLLPHMVLSTVCAFLSVEPSALRIESDRIIIPSESGVITIPTHRRSYAAHHQAGGFTTISYFGDENWLTAYDRSGQGEPVQHLSLKSVHLVSQVEDTLGRNLEIARELAGHLLTAALDDGTGQKLLDEAWSSGLGETKLSAVRKVMELGSVQELIRSIEALSESERASDPDSAAVAEAIRSLRRAVEVAGMQVERLWEERTRLRSQLNGKIALVGYSATGVVDRYPTPLHSLCPGMVIQGFVINSILTGFLKQTLPWWIGALVTLAAGLLTTLAVAWLSARAAAPVVLGLATSYVLANGLLFDYGARILPLAAPLMGIVSCWVLLSFARFITEQAERARITRRFRTYVDPSLVNYVLENPDKVRFDGQERLMTVAFTDLSGFTTISEKLRHQTVPLLNEYMSLMLPIIREHRAYWNKFLGDGILFFYNAPYDNPNHASDAVRTVLRMQEAMPAFNRSLAERGLPQCNVRAGLTSGIMIVGDAGSTHPVHGASDYTVIGDLVNLAARLESANKALGTRILVNQQARELCGDAFLFRPVGKIRVVGKTEGVMTWEPLAEASAADLESRRTVEFWESVLRAYSSGQFGDVLRLLQEAGGTAGPTKLVSTYQHLCEAYLHSPPQTDFDGTIVLSEK
jgi:CHASE2 domain-containing sensor protein/class 3 adenylate cyclase